MVESIVSMTCTFIWQWLETQNFISRLFKLGFMAGRLFEVMSFNILELFLWKATFSLNFGFGSFSLLSTFGLTSIRSFQAINLTVNGIENSKKNPQNWNRLSNSCCFKVEKKIRRTRFISIFYFEIHNLLKQRSFII